MKKITTNTSVKVRSLIVILILLINGLQSGLTQMPSDDQQTLCHQSYSMVQSTSYNIPSDIIDAMSPAQLYKKRNISKQFTEQFDFDNNGSMTYSILHGESINYYEDWMTKPVATIYTRNNRIIKREKPDSRGNYQSIRNNNEEAQLAFDTIAMVTSNMLNKMIPVPTDDELLDMDATFNENGEYIIPVAGQEGGIHYKPNRYLWTLTTVKDSKCNKKITKYYGPIDGYPDRFVLLLDRVEQPELAFDEFLIIRTDERRYYNWNIETCQTGGINYRLRNLSNELKLYPNPASDELFINHPSHWKNIRILIYNHKGIVQNHQLLNETDNQLIIDTRAYTNGMYIIKLMHDENVETLKFIKAN